jgi:hypothetical protein
VTTAAPTADKRRTNRLVPTLMALLFFGPLAVAVVMYYVGGDQWRPKGSVAHGILLPEPRTLPGGVMVLSGGATADFTGKWSLLYVGRGDCDDACKETLYRTRQVRRALGKEMGRVQRFFIATVGQPDTGFLAAEHPGLLVLPDGLSSRDTALATLGQFADGDVFIADPRGNVVMRFPAGTAMKDMHQDLVLLLKASQIG